MSTIEFLYLTEEEMLTAGVTDMSSCVEVMEEVFELLALGDYVMGGPNKNSHGIEISFEKSSPFANMPIDGPDRRFMAMCAYLGGRFDVSGLKWYGSNIENREKSLPRSIHVVVLNDKSTGAPIAIMPGNLISSMRTGAVPGVGAKYLAPEKSEVLGLIGAGVIGKTCALGILAARPDISLVKVYDVHNDSASALCKYISEKTGVKAKSANNIEKAVSGADIVNVATSGAIAPRIEPSWLKKQVLLSLPAIVDIPKDFVKSSKIVLDNWKQYEAWRDEYSHDPRSYHEKLELIGGDLLDYIQEGLLNADYFTNLGEVVIGKKNGRTSDDGAIILGMGGMPVEDVAWAYQVLEKAKELGVGQKLCLWDKPHML